MSEQFSNDGVATATGSSGTTSPAAGTTETWSVTSCTLPAITAPNFCYIADEASAAESEKIKVTACTGPGATSLTVVRGADGTSTVAHGTGAAYTQVIARATLTVLSSVDGLQFLTGGGTFTSAMVAAAQTAGYQGVFLDPRYVWDASGLVLGGSTALTGFIIESRMAGSIGYSANVAYDTSGYIKTDTGLPADGIQVYTNSPTGTHVQGITFRSCVFVGANPTSVIHFGGGIKRCGLEHCLVYNTSAVTATVGSASNGTAISSLTGTQSITCSATISGFPTGGGYLLVPVAVPTAGVLGGMAIIQYTGISGTQFTGCTLICGTNNGSLSTTSPLATIQPIGAAFLSDTGLTSSTGADLEDQWYAHCSFAGNYGIAIGIDLFGLHNHTNDTSWVDITTACLNGPLSMVDGYNQANGNQAGQNHEFFNWFDRSSPYIAQVWNAGGTLHFWGGEDQNQSNQAGAVAHLLDRGNSATVLVNRALNGSAPANILGGHLKAHGRCKWAGPFIHSGGTLDLSDPAGLYGGSSPMTITYPTGNTATLLLSGQYSPGAGPTITGTPSVTHTSNWT